MFHYDTYKWVLDNNPADVHEKYNTHEAPTNVPIDWFYMVLWVQHPFKLIKML
jgi:hypothetical protein